MVGWAKEITGLQRHGVLASEGDQGGTASQHPDENASEEGAIVLFKGDRKKTKGNNPRTSKGQYTERRRGRVILTTSKPFSLNEDGQLLRDRRGPYPKETTTMDLVASEPNLDRKGANLRIRRVPRWVGRDHGGKCRWIYLKMDPLMNG